MTFDVDYTKKHKIEKAILKEAGTAKTVMLAARMVLLIGVALGLVFLIWNLVDPSRHIVVVRDVPKKDYLTIWFNFITVTAVSAVISILLRTLGKNLGGRDIKERANESLLLQDGKLYYTFRTKFITPVNGRNLVVIPLDSIHEMSYNERLCEIHLFGTFSSDAYVDFAAECNSEPDSGNLSGFVIYDYFEPSLYHILKANVSEKHGGDQKW